MPNRNPSPRITALLPLALATLGACSGSPTVRREADPTLEQRAAEQQAADQKRRALPAALVQMDQLIDSHVRAVANQGVLRADRQAATIEKTLRDLAIEHYDALVTAAADAAEPAHQRIALGALGYSGKADAMHAILPGAQSGDEKLVNAAVLGLAILKNPLTPPGVLQAVMENAAFRPESRIQAAWALYRIQEANSLGSPVAAEILAIWRSLLGRPFHDVDPGIVASAVRGLGLGREPTDGALAARYTTHPTPRVRWMAAIALGRMNAQEQHEALIALLEPAETNANVRLAARKALEALAGGTDRGYDVAEWRAVFQRKGS